ncbi:MAG: hypothetical protein HY436_00135 [Candidatus Liptonbacteria bacterium]|nr:hypothetical protein [Candidatus Liptonbacteria bacterium]
MAKIAIVAFSFGGSGNPEFRECKPGPANIALGEIVDAFRLQSPKKEIVIQDYLKWCVHGADLVIMKHREPGKFLGSEEVADQAAEYLKERGVTRVILVAHHFLHWRKCKKLLEVHGFLVEVAKTGRVPFDPNSDGWWVHGPLHLLWYAVRQKLAGISGR